MFYEYFVIWFSLPTQIALVKTFFADMIRVSRNSFTDTRKLHLFYEQVLLDVLKVFCDTEHLFAVRC